MKFLGSISVLLALWAGVPTDLAFPDSRPTVDAWPSTDTPDPTVDSVRAELEAGRFWHASRILRARGADEPALTPPEVLLLARADAGWNNWDAVLTELEGADWLDLIGGGEGRLLVARALEALANPPDAALVDGNRLPELPCPARCVVKGDSKCLSIAAASIIAKVTRNRHMTELARHHPGYAWERNFGYGTPQHREGLASLGVTAHHRRSFKPIRKLLEESIESNT